MTKQQNVIDEGIDIEPCRTPVTIFAYSRKAYLFSNVASHITYRVIIQTIYLQVFQQDYQKPLIILLLLLQPIAHYLSLAPRIRSFLKGSFVYHNSYENQ